MFSNLYENLNNFYERLFRAYGRIIAKYYVYIIIFSLILNCLLSLGISKFQIITDTDELFTPVGSQAKKDEILIKSLFNEERLKSSEFFMHQLADMGKWAEINFLTCLNDHGKEENILQEKYLNKIKSIYEFIKKNAIVQTNNVSIGFEQICAKQNGKCLVDGLNLLNSNFYIKKLNDFMWKKELIMNEIKLNNDLTIEEKSKEFRFYVAGGSITDLTYNLGINSF